MKLQLANSILQFPAMAVGKFCLTSRLREVFRAEWREDFLRQTTKNLTDLLARKIWENSARIFLLIAVMW